MRTSIVATKRGTCPEAEELEVRLTEAEAPAPAELDEADETDERVEDWTELEVEARLEELVPFDALMLVYEPVLSVYLYD